MVFNKREQEDIGTFYKKGKSKAWEEANKLFPEKPKADVKITDEEKEDRLLGEEKNF